ncbi:MAG: polysaccharide biosynthesis protein, partial [Acidobacteria bacterium]|nr:polysaccharide biosynthesis protein [Acidobacteriota bacterium]
MKSLLLHHRRLVIGFYHFLLILFSLVTAYLLRFDFSIPLDEVAVLRQAMFIAIAVKMPVFLLTGIHRGWWRFVDISELVRVSLINVLASVSFGVMTMLFLGSRFPRSVYLIDFLLCFLLTTGLRFAVRLYNEALVGELSTNRGKGLLIYGAGAAGMMLLREIRSNPALGYHVLGFIDDDPKKKNALILGVKVLGMGRNVASIVDESNRSSSRVEEIVIAMPSAAGRQMREALANCRVTGVHCKTIPGFGELLKGRVLSAQIRNLSPSDLLAREAVRLEEDRIREHIIGRSVLVTGAAGSIGSELCRQLAHHKPRKLVAFDQAESELFKIDLKLRNCFSEIEIVPEIGDIQDFKRVKDVIARHAVDSVFHAAAYKHVPMMEANVAEAVKNNVQGTWNVALAAYENDVSDFLMISSDKAVNPTNIMGMTKRVAELIVSAMQSEDSGGTRFVSVRFGNVLGSNGSVVPLFQSQIEEGGPVTVTHPEVRRYFMTVREAVQLVLQASTMGKGSEIFVLDMGEPIRIVDLARNMIRLA